MKHFTIESVIVCKQRNFGKEKANEAIHDRAQRNVY